MNNYRDIEIAVNAVGKDNVNQNMGVSVRKKHVASAIVKTSPTYRQKAKREITNND
jgi:hypothetical protein